LFTAHPYPIKVAVDMMRSQILPLDLARSIGKYSKSSPEIFSADLLCSDFIVVVHHFADAVPADDNPIAARKIC
jgi:hypothetical protein